MERLSEVLARVCALTGARSVRRVESLQQLWSGYGEIVRVWLEGGSAAQVVVKWVQPPAAELVAGPEAQRSHARKLHSYAVEACFYEQYAPRCFDGCRVARALLCERLQQGWLFVLEDLDAAGWGGRREWLTAQQARTCLEWLASFHATFLHVSPQGLWEQGTYWHLATRPDELARSCDAELRAAAARIDERLRATRHPTLLHGDAKVENFCFGAAGAPVAAVDFQYVGAGCGVQDVAYFLSSCLEDAACAAHAPQLVDHYFVRLREQLALQRPELDARAVEAEWRGLYPVAWADLYRFLSGWAPALHTRQGYAGEMIRRALEA